MAGTYRQKPRPKAGVFKLTPAEKAILEKRPVNPRRTPPKPRPTAGVFKLTPAEKAILAKTPTSKKRAPKPRTTR